MKLKILLFIFAAVSLINAAGYWVSPLGSDNNNGSFSLPFLTIQKALDIAYAGDTITIMEGYYPVSTGLIIKTDSLLIKGAGNVIIDGNFINTNTKFFDAKKHTHLTFDNITIQNITSRGFWIDGNYSTVKNCKVINSWQSGICIIGASYCVVSNNYTYNVGTGTGALFGNGISLEGKVDTLCNYTPSNFNIIQNNHIIKNKHFGISMVVMYEDSTICLNDASVTEGNIIRYNWVDSCWSGIYLMQTKGIEVYNNIITNSSSGIYNIEGHGIKFDTDKRMFEIDGQGKVYNNTIAFSAGCGIYNITFKNMKFYNNSIYECNQANFFNYVRMDDTTGITISNNAYYGNNLNFKWGPHYIDINKWELHENVLVKDDPMFRDPLNKDFYLKIDSPLRGKGLNLNLFDGGYNNIDIAGHSRPSVYNLQQNVWDIGAFEYYGEGYTEVNDNPPAAFELYNNYPNPFNPSTTISFNLAKAEHVKLLVYNILGEIEAVLINGNMEEGIHKVQFHADGLSSGIYFYRLEVEGNAFTKKMVVIK